MMKSTHAAAHGRWPRRFDSRRRARLARRPTLEVMEPRTMLSTIVVNTLSDPSTATAGVTSLREAIAQAASTSGDDTITFDASLSGPVVLSQGQLVLADSSGSVTIQASAGVTMIDAGGTSRVIEVSYGTTATLEGLTVTGGSDDFGGGIYNQGTLNLDDCTVSGDMAGTGSGGGIDNDGTLSLSGCTVSGNTASGNGGGLSNGFGTMSLTDSTVSGNTAGGYGGGLYTIGGTLTLTFATVAGNGAEAPGSGTGSGGGIFAQASNYGATTTQLIDSIVSGNTAGSAATPDNLGGVAPVKSAGNLVGSGAVSLDPTLNLVGVDDAMLGPLQDNGGATDTMALLPGSPAIDAGVFLLSMPVTDQPRRPASPGSMARRRRLRVRHPHPHLRAV